MNFSHLAAIVRMRWQMMRNRFRRSSQANWIFTIILTVLAALCSFGSFVFTVGWGKFFLAKMDPFYVIYVWDAFAVMFLFSWMIGLMTELQRSEMLSLKNLLHLPISLREAFFLNYASSFASLTILLLVPTMLGVCVASVLHFGIKSLVAFALLISFLFMVTAVTYLLRGWLARLMENKRTRGTVIAVTTIGFVLICQLPMMVNMASIGSMGDAARERNAAYTTELSELEKQLKSESISLEDYTASVESTKEAFTQREKELSEATKAAITKKAKLVNASLPVGWLPYGASAAATGAVFTPWMCVTGMFTIGLASLVFSYRSTLRGYTGYHNKTYQAVARRKTKALSGESLLDQNVPLLTDTQSVIAMATLKSTLRAPEAKMALLTPLIFACVFGSMLFKGPLGQIPELALPWLGIGALTVSLMGMVQLMLNLFGLDRQGFRAYVLMPAQRRDILLGKNIGIFPIVGALSLLLIVFVGVVVKLEMTHIVATLLQVLIGYLLYSLISNYVSIVAPTGMAVGSMKPVSMKLSVVVIQLVAVILIPIVIIPAALALATEQLNTEVLHVVPNTIPVYLLLTLMQLPIAIWFYCRVLDRQGRYLHGREQAILDVISKVAD